ncbi:MAG: hypothetical protein ABMA64_07955 [Myxococcota bacterium]
MTLPAEAVWDAVQHRWVAGARAEDGSRAGLWRAWRADGTLAAESRYSHGLRHGTQRELHPDGALAIDSQWEHGRQGTTTFRCPSGPTDVEGFGAVSPAVRWWREESDGGYAVHKTRHYDGEGRELSWDGTPVPPRPPTVPHTARFVSPSEPTVLAPARWVDGRNELGTNRRLGRWVWWSAAGERLWTDRYDERGRRLSGGSALDPDPDQVALDALVGAGERPDVWGAVRKGWDEAFHQRVSDVLPALSPATVDAYLHLLEVGPTDGRPRPDLALRLVDRWFRAQTGAARGAEPILARGIGYAARIVDADRVRTWLSALRDPSPEVSALARRVTSGEADAALDRQLADPQGPDGVEVAARATRRLGLQRVLGHRRTAILLDPEDHAFGADGAALPIRIDRVHALGRYLLGVSETDERRQFRVGRRGWSAVHRYGRSLWLVSGRLDPETVRVEVALDLFVRCPDRSWTTEVVERFLSELPAGAVEVDPQQQAREYARDSERRRLDPRAPGFDDQELQLLRTGYALTAILPEP